MSGGYPVSPEWGKQTLVGYNSATSLGTAVTTGAANTMGSFTQIVASTAQDAIGFFVDMNSTALTANQIAYTVGIGGAGSEKVIVDSFWCQINSSCVASTFFPVPIPSGTRIAIKAQADQASNTADFSVRLVDGAFMGDGFAGVDQIGFVAATTVGTSTTTGAANTKGSWTQYIASTARDYAGLWLQYQAGDNGSIDVSVGTAGNEPSAIVIPDYVTSGIGDAHSTVFYTPIPSGTRLSARAQTVTAALPVYIVLYGLYA